MGFLAVLTLINQLVNESGTLTPLIISAIKEIEGATGKDINILLEEAEAKHNLDTTKIQNLLDETK